MRLSKAYNKKNLIDEDLVIHELEKNWKKESASSDYWSSSIRFHNNIVLVKLFFGYGENKVQRPSYYSSLSILDGTTMVPKFIAMPFYCWGTNYPDPWDVICLYRKEIHRLLFKSGSRNKKIFWLP